MVTNTIEIGTVLRPLRRVTRAARTAVSPRTPRPATHRTRLPGQAPRVPALARAALAGRQTRCPLPTSSFPLSKSRRARLAYPVAVALLLGLAFQTPQPVSAQTDTTPPTLSFAIVPSTGRNIQFRFSESVQASNLPPASAFTATADGSTVTLSGVVPTGAATTLSSGVSPLIRQGQTVVVTYTDPTAGDDANAIQDTAGNDAASFTTGVSGVPAVTNNSTLATTVPANWSLKPTGLASGDKFRLLFLSSTTRTATATDIADYNTFVQTRAAAGHADIQAYSAGFRVVGCTAAADARDNTETTYTSTTKGVPIYWLNGAKAADQYEDFYDGSWDDEANDKNESGTDGPDTSIAAGHPRTGCEHNGTEAFLGTASRALGNSSVRVARPNSSNANNGPLSSGNVSTSTDTGPMYGLSALFEVGTATAPGTPTGLTATASGTSTINLSWTAPASDGGSAITGYKIEVSPNGTSNWTNQVANTASTATTHAHSGLTAGTTRHYRVSAINSIGTGTASAVVNTTTDAATVTAPGAPTSLTATASGTSTINLSWTAPASTGGSAITGYKIEVSPNGTSNWTNRVANTNSTTTTYAHSGLAAGTTRHYRVSAINGIGTSTTSNVANATTTAADTTPPTLTSATVLANGQIIELQLSENVKRSNLPPASAFTATAGGSAVTLSLVFTSTADTYWISVPSLTVIRQGQVVVVTYTDPSTGDDVNAIQDVAGNDAATFTTGMNGVPAVTNNSTVNTPATGAPTIAGTPQVGETLTAVTTAIMDANGLNNVSYTYQWIRVDGSDSNIAGATASTYTLVAADEGKTIKVKVSFTDDASNPETLTSVATAVVSAAAATVPGAPTSLTATASGTSTINLSWTAPASTGGSAITGYKIEVSPNGTSNWTNRVANTNSTTTTYAHSGLAAGTTRHYRVSAINSVGTSTTSNVANATTETANTAPGAPTSLTATASGTSTINLSWTAPASTGGSAITGYKIEVSPNGTSNWTNRVANTNSTTTTYAHSGLAAGTTRHYRVSAINSVGTSTTSNVANATTETANTAPGAPTSLSATASGSSTINLSWSAPASTGGSAITGYKIEVSSDGGSSWSDLIANTGNANTTYAHSGLAAGATRHYRVSAINAVGTGPSSNVDDATAGRTTVTFNASSYTAEESGAPATVTVELSAVPLSPVTIPLVVTPQGGATPGDYEGLPSSVTFWTTGRSRTFTVRAIDDSNMDGGESVQIGFGTLPAGYAAGTHRTATVALVDDETEHIVNFGTAADATVKVREGPVPHRLTMVLDSEPQQPVTIPLVVTHVGGATAADYADLPASVTFAAGAKVAGFDIRAIPDGKVEIGEGLRLDFGALPAGVRKGAWGPYETIEFVDEAASVPGAPTSLSATASGSTGIDLSWTAPASNGGSAITGYKIEVSSNGGSSWSVLVADTGNANTTYAHSGLTAVATRHYRVSAINANGTGTHSNVANATTTGTTVPGAPTSLSATASGSSTINLSWSAPSSTGGSAITGYKIEVSSDGGSSWSEMVADTGNANTTYAHTGLAAVATRHYRVSAINANGTGTHSNVANATTGRTTVTFNASSYTAEESGALATVTVELSAVPSSAVTIPLVVTHLGGATPGDYEGLPSSVRFWTTGRSRTFTVRAIDDSNMDGGESVQIGFGTLPAGYAAGTHRTATVALVDDETELIVNFGTAADATVKVREGPVPHRLTMVLDSEPQQPMTIPLVVTHVGGATAADYTDLPASVTFAAGAKVAGFDIRAIPDQASEIGEGLRLDFGALPAGVRKGAWGPYETIEFVDAAPAANVSVSGTVVTVGYPGALDRGSTPSPLDFVVTVEVPGGEKAMAPVAAVAVRGSDVFLQLARPVAPDDTVTLSYLADAMHQIRDEAGSPAAPLRDAPVRNDTGASGLGPEAGLVARAAIPASLEALPEGAQEGVRIERLDLSSRNLTDVSALSALTGLRELDLRDNAIEDLRPLTGLTGLEALYLSGNQIEDLGPLAGLTGLKVLDLAGNRITDLWPLSGLTGLRELDLRHNAVEDLGPLAGMAGLKALDLAGNRITDLWGPAYLTALERLNLADNAVEDLWPLQRLTDLKVLLLDGNRITGVLALAPMAELANLGLAGNPVADLWPLVGLGRLHRLDLSGNAVADLSALGRLENLRWLWLDPAPAAELEASPPPAGRVAAPLSIEPTPGIEGDGLEPQRAAPDPAHRSGAGAVDATARR